MLAQRGTEDKERDTGQKKDEEMEQEQGKEQSRQGLPGSGLFLSANQLEK